MSAENSKDLKTLVAQLKGAGQLTIGDTPSKAVTAHELGQQNAPRHVQAVPKDTGGPASRFRSIEQDKPAPIKGPTLDR